MKKYPRTTAQERKRVVKNIRQGNFDKELLLKCIKEIQPTLTDAYWNCIVERKSYDKMYVPMDKKWFYECRNRMISLYMERMK